MRDVLPFEKYPPLAQPQHPENGFHRGRFAGAVRPDDNGNLAGFDTDSAPVKDVGASVPANHVLADKEAHDALPARGRFFRPVPR